jgi:hypothetical protein
MIDGIRVDARDHIEPTFRVPAVRIDYGYMEPAGIEPATSCLQRIPRDPWERTRNPRACRDLLPRLGAYVPRATAGIYPLFPGSARLFRH